MIGFISSFFARGEPTLAEAGARDVSMIAALHGVSFRRGWSEQEVEGLLLDRHVIAHRAMMGANLAGFIMSRLVEDEAEILSVAVARRQRARGPRAQTTWSASAPTCRPWRACCIFGSRRTQ